MYSERESLHFTWSYLEQAVVLNKYGVAGQVAVHDRRFAAVQVAQRWQDLATPATETWRVIAALRRGGRAMTYQHEGGRRALQSQISADWRRCAGSFGTRPVARSAGHTGYLNKRFNSRLGRRKPRLPAFSCWCFLSGHFGHLSEIPETFL